MNKALEEEWHKFIEELAPLMLKTPGDIERIKDCTLIEEWRHDQGWSFDDSDLDGDNWKATYELLEDDYTRPDLMEEYKDYALRCGLDAGVMKLKYPRIAKEMGL